MSESDTYSQTRGYRRCQRCDTEPTLRCQILDSRNGKTIRMFECKCGEKTWSE
jgi:hypothetical protein